MKDKQTLKAIQFLKKKIDKDWGRCERDMAWGCWACYAQFAWKFLKEWERQILEKD